MSNIIALIFDFDITLSPQFQQKVIFDHWGIDEETFWAECGALGKRGYDMEYSYMRNLIDYGRRDSRYALTVASIRL